MRRSPVLRLDRSVARTAFALSRRTCGSAVACPNATLDLCRAGDEQVLVTLSPLEVDGDGELVFVWSDIASCLAPGLYEARLESQCVPCGEFLVQIGEPCMVVGATNIEYGPACEGSDDGCAMTTVCTPPTACACAPLPTIYVPPYDVSRGC